MLLISLQVENYGDEQENAFDAGRNEERRDDRW